VHTQAGQHGELAEFASLEHRLLSERERALAAEATQLRADVAAAAAQLADARQRLVDTDAALLGRDEEVRQLRGELEAAQAAAGAAATVAAEWRQRSEQYDRDRQMAADNIRCLFEEGGGRSALQHLPGSCTLLLPASSANQLAATTCVVPALCSRCSPCRKAERELELVAQDNERMFRQVGALSWQR
jgi:multidrug efflux pump subunit AcrA (membrane-fusion protein)